MKKAALIANPTSRNAPPAERLRAAASAMATEGWQVDLAVTDGAGHATVLARDAASAGASVVFACGGDGTINEVLNGIAGTPAALAVVRAGMGDVFAKEIGVPRPPEAALRLLVTGRRQHFDLGTIEIAGSRRYFMCMAGAGFDAYVEHRVPSSAKRRLGSTAYALWALAGLARYRARRVQFRVDGVASDCDLYWLLAGNTRSYGGLIDITSRAVVDDGLLDAYVFAGDGPLWLAATAARLAVRRADGARGVAFHKTGSIEIMTPGLPLQVDGEYIGESPATIGVAPAAVDVLLPPGKGLKLFGH